MKTATVPSPASFKRKFPFASEFITDGNGHVSKVIVDVNTFERLMEEFEDAALVRALKQVRHEKPMTKAEALKELERD
jgi:hypothetical protein